MKLACKNGADESFAGLTELDIVCIAWSSYAFTAPALRFMMVHSRLDVQYPTIMLSRIHPLYQIHLRSIPQVRLLTLSRSALPMMGLEYHDTGRVVLCSQVSHRDTPVRQSLIINLTLTQ